jgi:hypothetical protein
MPDTLNNIDLFNITAICLFDKLYDAFPNPIDIETRELGIRASPNGAEVSEAVRFALYAENAVSWLVEEGFVRFEPPRFATTFRKVRLTLKGLTVLGYLPSAVQRNETPETLITKIKRSLSAGAEKAGTEVVKSLLTEVFKLAMSPSVTQVAATIMQA